MDIIQSGDDHGSCPTCWIHWVLATVPIPVPGTSLVAGTDFIAGRVLPTRLPQVCADCTCDSARIQTQTALGEDEENRDSDGASSRCVERAEGEGGVDEATATALTVFVHRRRRRVWRMDEVGDDDVRARRGRSAVVVVACGGTRDGG